MAVKYGTTLSGGTQDYLDTAGNVVWDSSNNAGYWNNVAAFARDDDEGLIQSGSRSTNPDSSVYLEIATGSLDDKEYVFWSNNGNSLTSGESVDVPAGINQRLERIWKYSLASGTTVSMVNMTFDAAAASSLFRTDDVQLRLLVSTTPTFVGANVYTADDIAGGTISFDDLVLSDGWYFTFAQTSPQIANGPVAKVVQKISSLTGGLEGVLS